jgi:glucose uptake protein GlcU
MRNGQLALEFMFAVCALTLLVIGISFVVESQQKNVRDKAEDQGARADCLRLSDAIVAAFTNGGATINVKTTHDARVQASSQVIDVEDIVCTVPLRTVRNGAATSFVLAKGDVIVSSDGHEVNVENA